MAYITVVILSLLTLNCVAHAAHVLPALPLAQIDRLTMPLADISIQPIAYASGSYKLSGQNSEELHVLAKKLDEFAVYIIVEAYTDLDGDELANLELSRMRAAEVRAALLAGGFLHESQVIAVGYGERFANKSDARNKSHDRRVVLTLRQAMDSIEPPAVLLAKMEERGIRFAQTPVYTVPHEDARVRLVESADAAWFLTFYFNFAMNLAISTDFSNYGAMGFSLGLHSPWALMDWQLGLRLTQVSGETSRRQQKGELSLLTIQAILAKNLIKTKLLSLDLQANPGFSQVNFLAVSTSNPVPTGSNQRLGQQTPMAGVSAISSFRIPKYTFRPALGLSCDISQVAVTLSVLLGVSQTL